MWISQSYLGEVEPKADFFVYYFFEDYNPDQKRITHDVLPALEDLGQLFGSRVSLLMPNPRYAITIESELRDKFQDLWWVFQGKLPGLFVSSSPLPLLDPRSDQGHFFTFVGKNPKDVIAHVRELAEEHLKKRDISKQSTKKARKISIYHQFIDALEAKPGFAGFRVDLKKLLKINV